MRRITLGRIVTILILLSIGEIYGQGVTEIESLKQRLPLATGLERLDILKTLSGATRYSDVVASIGYAEEMLTLSRLIEEPSQNIQALISAGAAYLVAGKNEKALEYGYNALQISRQIQNVHGMLMAYELLGEIFRSVGDLQRSMNYFQSAFNMDRSTMTPDDLHVLGYIYLHVGKLERSHRNYDDAISYLRESKTILEKSSHPELAAWSVNLIANIYSIKGDQRKAIELNEQLIPLLESIDGKRYKSKLGKIYNDIGWYKSLVGDFAGALEANLKALRYRMLWDRKEQYCSSLRNIGNLHIKFGYYEEGVEYFKRALKQLEPLTSIDALLLKNMTSRDLADVLKETGDNLSAIDILEQHIVYRDSLAKLRYNSDLIQQQLKHDLEEVNQNRIEQQEKSQRDRRVISILLMVSIALGIVMVLTGFFLYNWMRFGKRLKHINEQLQYHIQKRDEIQQQLERSNKDLQEYAYVTSHDLQQPIRQISNFLQLIQRRGESTLNSLTMSKLDLSITIAHRMRDMIQGLLEYSRLKPSREKWRQFPLHQAVKRALDTLSDRIDSTETTVEAHSLPEISGDITQISRIFQNLIDNSIKFRTDRPVVIKITSQLVRDHWEVRFTDNGIGIEGNFQMNAFRIFKRFHDDDQYPGTGIGLASCKRIVEQHDGAIRIESVAGSGTTVIMTFPCIQNPNPTKES